MQSPIKIPMAFSTKTENKILNSVWNPKRSQIVEEILRKNKAGGIMLSDFKVY